MYIANRCFHRSAKSILRAGEILALVLLWQTTASPLMGQFGSTVQQFPQVVVNGGSTTSFTVHNPSSTKTINVSVQLYLPDGTALADQQVELTAGATKTLVFGDPQASLTRGSAELKSDDDFIATEFFQLFIGETKPRVGVLPSPPSEEVRFLGFVNNQFTSGMAVHNPSPTEQTQFTVRVKDMAGQQPVPEKMLTLDPLQSEAAFLNEPTLFGEGLSNFEGVVEISVNSPPVAVLSLIQETSGDVATVAVETQSFVLTGETNTSLGRGALSSNTTGDHNTANGANALRDNTEGRENTANGFQALLSNTTGGGNTANGFNSLFANTTGIFNTATGGQALFSNTTGNFNTATGLSALFSNKEGSGNTATGDEALGANTTGSNNTATGRFALLLNTTGSNNTANGVGALQSNTEGSNNTVLGFSGRCLGGRFDQRRRDRGWSHCRCKRQDSPGQCQCHSHRGRGRVYLHLGQDQEAELPAGGWGRGASQTPIAGDSELEPHRTRPRKVPSLWPHGPGFLRCLRPGRCWDHRHPDDHQHE